MHKFSSLAKEEWIPHRGRRRGWLAAVALLIASASLHAEARLIVLGDSLTHGYALPAGQAYPALLQKKINEDGLDWTVINAGVSGDTTAGGLARLNWLLRGRVDGVIVALGANDGLRGASTASIEKNLQAIIDRIRQSHPEAFILLVGMKMPPNLGRDYREQFDALFPALAEKNDLPLLPFLLEGVGGRRELNLADGIHPNAEGQKILADNVWAKLRPLLEISGGQNGD